MFGSKHRAVNGALLALLVLMVTSARSAEGAPLIIENKVLLGDISGRIDHLAYDPRRQRLYVAELGNDSVGIVDLKAGQLLRTVGGFEEPQGIGYEASTDTVYVANAGDGSVRLFRGEDFAALGTIPLGSDADNVRIDEIAHKVYVGYGDGALAIIDPVSRKRTADIRLKGHPESFRLDPNGPNIYVNVPDADEIAVVARDQGKQISSWPTANLRANYPMSLDAANRRVVAIFRHPARLESFDARTGSHAASAESCSDADDVFVDRKRNRVYVICGQGVVDTYTSSGNAYARVGRLTTSGGSRTGLFIPELDRLVVAIRAARGEHASVWIVRPAP